MSRIFIVLALFSLLASACATSQEEVPVEETPVVQAEPEPQPEPRVVAEPVPAAPDPAASEASESMRRLPETASSIPMMGLAGVGALALAGALRVARRFIR